MAARLIVALLLAVAGCGGPTTVLVDVSLGTGAAVPSQLSVSVFDPRGALAQQHLLKGANLPGNLVIDGLADVAQTLRVVVAAVPAGPLVTGVAVNTRPHEQARAVIVLGPSADPDGDGVPSNVDNCPDAANPTQGDVNGDGAGDACASGDGGPADLGDLIAIDGATDGGSDLAPPDLSINCGSALCEDFEASAFNLTRWSVGEIKATVRLDTTKHNRGTQSMHVHSFGSDGGATTAATISGILTENDTFNPTQPTFIALRMFIFLPTNGSSFRLAGAYQAVSPYGETALIIDNGTLNAFNNIVQPEVYTPGQALPLNQWVCIEWHIDSGTPQGTRVFVDGVERVGIRQTLSVRPSPTLKELAIGYEDYQPTAAVAPSDIWIDDVIVATQPVGCAR